VEVIVYKSNGAKLPVSPRAGERAAAFAVIDDCRFKTCSRDLAGLVDASFYVICLDVHEERYV
jgi:hypothetical protein